jgi:hypothetical protein
LLLPEEVKDKTKFSLPKISSRYILPAFVIGIALWGLWTNDGAKYFSKLFQFVPLDKSFSLFEFHFFNYADTNVTNISLIIFYIILLIFTGLTIKKNFTLIPVLGLLSCAYLLTSMNLINWIYFLIWMIIGLVVYFLYSHKNSKLHV